MCIRDRPWYFNISNKGGVAMHQYFLPGYPASHSCIRMYEEDAKWIFDWAQQWEISEDGATVIKNGTPVLLFGTYNFEEPSAWKILPDVYKRQNFEGLKLVGLKPMKKYQVINGKLECVFYLYEMYEGTKRKQKEVISE